jgi:hypothetical protein
VEAELWSRKARSGPRWARMGSDGLEWAATEAVVERRVSSCVDDGGPRHRGAVESQRRTHAEVRTQVGVPSSVMVALMVGPVRGFASVFYSRDGLAGSG